MAPGSKAQVNSIIQNALRDPTHENIMKAINDLKSLAAAEAANDLTSVDWALEFMVGLAEDVGLDPSKAGKVDEDTR